MFVRKCPFCKSTKGFSVDVRLSGYHTFNVKFNGEIISQNREPVDNVEKYGSCLNCKRVIPIENLKFEKQ